MVLTGCDDLQTDRVVSPTDGVEPDDPATWPADTTLLIAARQRIHGYRLGLRLVGDEEGTAAELEDLWRQQQERLELLITLGGVPLPDLLDDPAVTLPDSTGSTGSTGAAATTAAPDEDDGEDEEQDRPTASDLGRVLRDDRTEACRDLSTATPTNLLLLASLTAQHVASAAWLGSPVEWGPLPGPSGAAAVPVLAAARPAVFGLEVVAARSAPDSDERADYEAVLVPLRGLTRQLSTLAGQAAPVAPLGYDLPEPLETAEERRDLARRLVADLGPATLEAAQRVPGDLAQLTGVVRIVSEAATWGALLGGSRRAFPGMTLP
ncbi:hypothetical protein GCM10011509_08060 [Ornithinimicrobium pekingense]|uniref:DUF4439 domain-containing protein n=1 Tax=Ornithinimicrobium pekingense TaxID=384677 RepID=A0ABQ2F4U1_9MICO|nr:hypothetical protein GCM10011509_08060 [Ornithinimicrobium pekingense]